MTTAEQVRRSVEGLTIPALLRRNAQDFPDHPALTSGIGPNTTTLTWSQLRTEVSALTRGLTALRLRRGDRMLIAISKRPEHWVCDLAAIHIGALPCTTYDTLSTEQSTSSPSTATLRCWPWRAPGPRPTASAPPTSTRSPPIPRCARRWTRR
ncbi:AMP-binding protein [Saccharopolyspora aridisoli]|uniref:AMP-binding protein n=1 Tax=Saccharopolyspora aridisoli TaxID=2530385 RepID=UPI001F382937|nr:AMP-binding protein [Saccharopolyspora aridisoli]